MSTTCKTKLQLYEDIRLTSKALKQIVELVLFALDFNITSDNYMALNIAVMQKDLQHFKVKGAMKAMLEVATIILDAIISASKIGVAKRKISYLIL